MCVQTLLRLLPVCPAGMHPGHWRKRGVAEIAKFCGEASERDSPFQMNDSSDQAAAIGRVNVLGVGVSAINMDLALAAIAGALERREKGYLCVTGVHGFSEAQTDEGFREILNRAFLCTPDGMPLVWVGRWLGRKEMGRVYGPDLMLAVLARSEERRV